MQRMATLGRRIAGARHEAGLLQEELADKVGVSKSAVQQWERGRAHPRINHLAEIARITNKPIIHFIEAQVRETRPAEISAITAQRPAPYPGVEALLADEPTCTSLGVTPDEARLLRDGWSLPLGPKTLPEAVKLLQTLRDMSSRRGA